MKNLFIDSNIWLSLYHFTSDDLTQFEKLKDFLDKDIRLWIPHQVYDEVLRNREAKIQDAFKKFEFSKIQYPVFCRQYDEYTQFTTDYNELLKRHTAWKRKIEGDIQSVNLPADKTIKTRKQKFELYIPHDGTEKPVVRLFENDATISHTICVNILISALIEGYKNYKKSNPEFKHDFSHIWFEG